MGIFGAVSGEKWAFFGGISGEKWAFFSFSPIVLFIKSVTTLLVFFRGAAHTLVVSSPFYLVPGCSSISSKQKFGNKTPGENENSKLLTPRASLLPTD